MLYEKKTSLRFQELISAPSLPESIMALRLWLPGGAGIETAVHGHPDYAFYLLVQGKVGVENFVRTKTGLECTGKQLLSPGDHLCMTGVPQTFDNAIHRITALQKSLSVHVYSDDALEGVCFPDYPALSPFFVEAHSIETNLSTC